MQVVRVRTYECTDDAKQAKQDHTQLTAAIAVAVCATVRMDHPRVATVTRILRGNLARHAGVSAF